MTKDDVDTLKALINTNKAPLNTFDPNSTIVKSVAHNLALDRAIYLIAAYSQGSYTAEYLKRVKELHDA